MNTRRDYQGRLNMDAVRGIHRSGSTTSLRQEDLSRNRVDSLDYTAEWINRVELPRKAHSTCPV